MPVTWIVYDCPADRGWFACPEPAPEATICPWGESVKVSTVLIGTVIVPAVSATPTIVGVALRAADANAVLEVAIDDDRMIPVGNVKVATEVPEQADEVADAPNAETVAVPVLLQVNVTVRVLDPVAVNATFVTEIVPEASVSDTAGAS